MSTQTYPVTPALLTALNNAEAEAVAAQAAARAVFKTVQVATLDGVAAPEGSTLVFKDGAFVVTTPDEAKKDDGSPATD